MIVLVVAVAAGGMIDEPEDEMMDAVSTVVRS